MSQALSSPAWNYFLNIAGVLSENKDTDLLTKNREDGKFTTPFICVELCQSMPKRFMLLNELLIVMCLLGYDYREKYTQVWLFTSCTREGIPGS